MIRFREVLPSDAEMLLGWRTMPRVASQMARTVSLNLEDQRQWLLACYDRPDCYHWVIQFQDKPVGLINLTNFSPATGGTAWGFYIVDDAALGLGAFVPPIFTTLFFLSSGCIEFMPRFLKAMQRLLSFTPCTAMNDSLRVTDLFRRTA